MATKFYKFADITFKITSFFAYFEEFAKDYVVDEEKNAFEISLTEQDSIDWKNEHEDAKDFPLYYLETLVIHSRVASILSKFNTFIFHGSTIYLDNPNNSYIFTAPSGTGKSTHVRLLKELLGDRINYINDDKPFIKIEDNKYYLYGSPWNGKERQSENIKGELKGVLVLERSKTNSVERMHPTLAINYLIKQIHLPKGLNETSNGMKLIMDLLKNIPIYLLKVNMDIDAAKTSYEVMKEKANEN